MSDSRVQLLSLDSARRIGGGQVSIERILRNLDRSRFRVALACPQGSELGARLAESDVTILPFVPPSRYPRYRASDLLASGWTRVAALPVATALCLGRLAAWGRNRDRVVIHANTFQSGLIGAVLASILGRPLAFHDRILKNHGNLEKWLCGRADAVIAITRGVSSKWGEEFRRKTFVLVDGADLQSFHPRGDRSLRDRLGIAPERTAILAVSRIAEEKGLDVLVEAAARIGEGAELIFAGEPFRPEDGRYQKRVEALAARRGVRAHFIGFQSDVVPAFDAADIFVLPSHSEPFGQVVIEAMAMGKPIVVPRSGGPLEIIEEDVTGLFFEPRDPDSLAARLRELIGQPRLRERLGRSALDAARTHFDVFRTYELFGTLIEGLAAGRPPGEREPGPH